MKSSSHPSRVGTGVVGSVVVLLWMHGMIQASDYESAVGAAAQVRNTWQAPSVFAGLSVIDDSRLTTLTVDDGQGGTKTIDAVKVVTLTRFTDPYRTAQPLQRFEVDTAGNFRGNIWVTVDGDIERYYADKSLPLTDNPTVTLHIAEALGISSSDAYEALSFYVEPRFVTRPSFNPDIAGRGAPPWAGDTYTLANLEGVDPSFWAFAPTVSVDGSYQRPFTSFEGPESYAAWMNAWSAVSYDLSGDRAFPYTGLGWTWNWNPDPHLNGFALSEFIVSGGAEIYFDSLQTPLALVVPEPGSLALIGTGAWVVALFCSVRRRGL